MITKKERKLLHLAEQINKGFKREFQSSMNKEHIKKSPMPRNWRKYTEHKGKKFFEGFFEV